MFYTYTMIYSDLDLYLKFGKGKVFINGEHYIPCTGFDVENGFVEGWVLENKSPPTAKMVDGEPVQERVYGTVTIQLNDGSWYNGD